MPNLNLLMSLGVILFFITWLISPGIKEGFSAFKKNKVAILVAGLFVLHLIWLINTSDFNYALKDLRVKLPLLILALVLGSIPITKKQVKLIFLALSLGVWLATISAYYRYFQLPEGFTDYREIVQGVSHIRLSLLMVMLVMSIIYFWNELTFIWKIYGGVVLMNTIVFFNALQSATGIIILAILLCVYLVYFVFKMAKPWAIVVTVSMLILGLAGAIYYSVNYYENYFVAKSKDAPIDKLTSRGNEYDDLPETGLIENGYRTYAYFANSEMIEAWNERSNVLMLADSVDVTLNFTLMRYLTSKGLRKDYSGVMALTDKDIHNIENGFPNQIYADESGLKLRFHSFMFGLHVYKVTGDVTGSSSFQRILFWKVAWNIVKRNFAFGVGTGDVKNEMKAMHNEMHPDLDERYWLRAHNQFLTFFVAFGVLGFAYFIFLFGYTFRARRKNLLALAFLLIAFISCFTEDTIETQAGVTFFAFFFCLFSKPFEENDSLVNPNK